MYSKSDCARNLHLLFRVSLYSYHSRPEFDNIQLQWKIFQETPCNHCCSIQISEICINYYKFSRVQQLILNWWHIFHFSLSIFIFHVQSLFVLNYADFFSVLVRIGILSNLISSVWRIKQYIQYTFLKSKVTFSFSVHLDDKISLYL